MQTNTAEQLTAQLSAPPISPDDVQIFDTFVLDHPNLFAGVRTAKNQLRQRHNNGLTESGAVFVKNKRAYVVISRYMHWLVSGE